MTQQYTAPSSVSPSPGYADGPRLLADIGGTNARFALETAPGQTGLIAVLPCADYPTLADALRAYLGSPKVLAAGVGALRHAALAIANPITGDLVRMTNHHWEFSIAALRLECGFETLEVVNDFTALARALPHLADSQKRQIGGGAARARTPLGLVGAGTGLGVSGLIPAGDSWTALLSEGGHVTFSPANETEIAILQFAWRQYEHVSAERLLSGDGIELIYRALAHHAGQVAQEFDAPEISRRALAGECVLCDRAIEAFCGMLGTVAGNLAITLGAQGGIYIGGGIVPRLGERFARSCFRSRFEQKGRFVNYLAQVPTFVITAEYPAFLGVSAILAEKLGS
ncbi:glucokinase [Massilia scottii]|uniref:glucokinase n=1 Tax=Massilia scottii TaxID=3057166 RepID=UPI002796CB14|nr:glucokinase [Massilia sp. CCM 9029]MDQ1832941.1 glucokinase [Massilia sp. CCM 9029]